MAGFDQEVATLSKPGCSEQFFSMSFFESSGLITTIVMNHFTLSASFSDSLNSSEL